MGTASTMALVAEALGTIVPGLAGTPAPDARLLEAAQRPAGSRSSSSRRTGAQRRSSRRRSFHNAIVALAAIGGSTNAVVHLLAIAGRLGIDLTIDDFDRIGASVPLLVNLQPAGTLPDGRPPPRRRLPRGAARGARPARPRRAHDHRHARSSTTSTTRRSGTPTSSRTASAPLPARRGDRVLRGNLAPGGALIKPAAASPHLLKHRGRAVVFDIDRGLPRAHRRPRPRRRRGLRAGAARLRADGLPGHARGRRTCRCRRSCSSRACATWSASATDACRAPPTAPSCCT